MTLTELTDLIKNYSDNSETTFTNTIPDFIKNAEDRIFNLVQSDFFRKNQLGTMEAGNRFLTCPSDFILSFALAVIDSSDDYHYLDKKHPTFMQEYVPDITDTSLRGLPLYYADYDKELTTESSGTTIVLAPIPDVNYSVELSYLYRPTSLVTNTTGTYLSQNARESMIYGSLVEAYTFMKGEQDLLATYEKRFIESIDRFKKNRAEGRGRRDEYRYDSLRSQVS